jgi:hypothetical protein
MVVQITGDRNWTDRAIMQDEFMKLCPSDRIIQGEARGADLMAKELAIQYHIQHTDVPAQWDVHGRAAGPIRNIEMLKHNPDVVWAFHNNLAQSRGTLHMVKEAMKRGLLIRYFFTPAVHNMHSLSNAWTSLPSYVYIGRKGRGYDGKWGNPIIRNMQCPNCGRTHTDNNTLVRCYEDILVRCVDLDPSYLEPLRGKHLVCFCKPAACHGDVILRMLGD